MTHIKHRHRGLIRVLRLMRLLRSRATIDELAERLGCSPRTLFRDMEVLRAVGVPLRAVAAVRYPDGSFTPTEYWISVERVRASARRRAESDAQVSGDTNGQDHHHTGARPRPDRQARGLSGL